MIARVALACAVLAVATTPALAPIEAGYGALGPWFCGLVADWKAVMSRDHPHVDRSMPAIERRCHLPREHRL